MAVVYHPRWYRAVLRGRVQSHEKPHLNLSTENHTLDALTSSRIDNLISSWFVLPGPSCQCAADCHCKTCGKAEESCASCADGCTCGEPILFIALPSKSRIYHLLLHCLFAMSLLRKSQLCNISREVSCLSYGAKCPLSAIGTTSLHLTMHAHGIPVLCWRFDIKGGVACNCKMPIATFGV